MQPGQRASHLIIPTAMGQKPQVPVLDKFLKIQWVFITHSECLLSTYTCQVLC